jgi:hypothetical protein
VQKGKQWLVCERLRALGFSNQRTIRLYGEELHLVSDPAPDGNGYTVEVFAGKTSHAKRVRVPLPVVRMVEQEISLKAESGTAA